MGRVPVSTKVKTDLNRFPYTMVDPVTVLDEQEKWNRLWEAYSSGSNQGPAVLGRELDQVAHFVLGRGGRARDHHASPAGCASPRAPCIASRRR